MRGRFRSALTAAATVMLVAAGGVASAAAGPVLSWSPTTSPGSYNYGQLTPGQTTSTMFTLKNSGGSASSALRITLTGSAAFSKTADTCTGTSLGRRMTCNVTVVYAPTTPSQNDTGTLTATGIKPAATASLTLTGSAAAKATPAITTVQQPATGPVGTVIGDQATVTGGFNPTGTVTFNLFNNPDCDSPLYTQTEPLTSGGVATTVLGPATAAFTAYWVASYNGDSNNNPVSSGCADEPVTITPFQPTITTTPQPATATVGTAIFDQATVTGGFHMEGDVSFTLYDNPSCSGNPLFISPLVRVSGDTATVTSQQPYTTTAAGTFYWVARFLGDHANLPATTGCGDEPVTIT